MKNKLFMIYLNNIFHIILVVWQNFRKYDHKISKNNNKIDDKIIEETTTYPFTEIYIETA